MRLCNRLYIRIDQLGGSCVHLQFIRADAILLRHRIQIIGPLSAFYCECSDRSCRCRSGHRYASQRLSGSGYLSACLLELLAQGRQLDISERSHFLLELLELGFRLDDLSLQFLILSRVLVDALRVELLLHIIESLELVLRLFDPLFEELLFLSEQRHICRIHIEALVYRSEGLVNVIRRVLYVLDGLLQFGSIAVKFYCYSFDVACHSLSPESIPVGLCGRPSCLFRFFFFL